MHVRTDPTGARVDVDGLGEVCVKTPCTFQAPKGREITVRVRGRSASVVRSLVFNDATDLDLRLAGTAKRKPARTQPAAGAPGDLKVPALFR